MIVTGGNSGIGYEVARYLCEGGNDVILACRDKEKGEEAVSNIKHDLPRSIVSFMEVGSLTILVLNLYNNLFSQILKYRANFTKYKARNGNKNIGNLLKLPQVFLWTQQIYCLVCTDLYSHLRDVALMTSLHDVMSTRVDNSDLPG